ncbi:hypothetical protein Glove_303g119 [Diversispora epigaea]|uniref:Uncharacterized protein n=1 Tax=Diversispora epigaea TaxID=1348612 RepID=A0A397HUS9_9GLOM|nr:hypothetical protein Glove_303g119 [Diversispora epigaea]
MNTLTPEYLKWEAKLTKLPSILTDKIRSRFCKRYKKKTGLDPWLNFETFQIEEDTDDYMSHDCVIKISKFPEEKSTIHEAVHKRFLFLSYTNSNAWYQDVFKYTDLKVKCPVCKKVHTHQDIWDNWSCLDKDDHYFLNCPFHIDQKKIIIAVQSLSETQGEVPNKTHLYQPEAGLRQYAIEHGMDPEKFVERLIGEELSHHGILKSGLSTAWLNDLMKEWEEIYTQFVQIFSQNFDSIKKKTLFVPQVNVQFTSSKRQFPISILPKNLEERQQYIIEMVLERFPDLTLKHSFKDDYFEFNRSIPCLLYNKNHKKENIRNHIEGIWGSSEYCGEKAYRLYCYINKYQNSIHIVSIKT